MAMRTESDPVPSYDPSQRPSPKVVARGDALEAGTATQRESVFHTKNRFLAQTYHSLIRLPA